MTPDDYTSVCVIFLAISCGLSFVAGFFACSAGF